MHRKLKFSIELKRENVIYFVITLLLFFSVIQASLLGYVNASAVSLIYSLSIVLRSVLAALWFVSKPTFRKKELGELIILLVLIVISYLNIGSLTLFDLFFVCLAYKKLKYERIIDCFLIGILFGLAVVLLLNYIGILPVYSIYRYGTTSTRISYGFSHPNVCGRMILYLCMLWSLKRRKDIKLIELVLMSAIAYWVYIYPNSITSSLMIVLLVTLILISKGYEFLFKREIASSGIVRWVSMILIPTAFLLTFYLVINSGNHSVLEDISETFYSRFWGGLTAIQQFPIKLFGNRIHMVGAAERYFRRTTESYFTIDCLYVLLPVRYGIVITVYIAYRIIDAIRTTLQFKQTYLLMVLIIMLVYSFAENGLTLFYSSFVFICASCLKNKEGE